MIAIKATACFFGAFALAVGFLFLLKDLMGTRPFLKPNYAGREIPGYAGIVFFPCMVLMFLASALIPFIRDKSDGWIRVYALLSGMCMLGLTDDVFGTSHQKGFGGHIGSLARGRITTGALKAMGGFALSIAVLLPYSVPRWEVLVNASITALSANLFNLLDMRPGRALKAFFPLFGLVVFLLKDSGAGVLCPVCASAGIALALFPGDLREIHMMGDAGSNVIGATIGFGICAGLIESLPWRIVALIIVAFLNLLSEWYSFTKIIESSKILSWIDNAGRKSWE